jgi:hypothetical protein
MDWLGVVCCGMGGCIWAGAYDGRWSGIADILGNATNMVVDDKACILCGCGGGIVGFGGVGMVRFDGSSCTWLLGIVVVVYLVECCFMVVEVEGLVVLAGLVD